MSPVTLFCNDTAQATAETLIMLPLFLLVALATIQVAELSIALVMTHYAASSIANKMIREHWISDSTARTAAINGTELSPAPGASFADAKLQALSMGFMQPLPVRVCVFSLDTTNKVTADLKVFATVQINTLPLVAPFLGAILGTNFTAQGGAAPCDDNDVLGPFYFSAGANYFLVRAHVRTRMNYIAQ